jgi:hypothetical protein
MRFTVFCFFFLQIGCFAAFAQCGSITANDKGGLKPADPKTVSPFLSDSLPKANRQTLIEDSISMNYLIPDSSQGSQFIDSLLKTGLNTLLLQTAPAIKNRGSQQNGRLRNVRFDWVIAVIIGLLLFTGLLNLFFGSDIKNVLRSLYSKNSLSQTDKESGLINSWAFIGLVLYQLTQYYNAAYGIGGFQLFTWLSVATGLLVVLKFVLLKFIGFVFEIGSVIGGYIAVLNLTYFTMAFVLLCVSICFSLLANQFIPLLLIGAAGLIAFVLVWQYLRNSINIISDFRFHKFYLFIYLCALEICPVLILVKALNI